jgi:hypothetical protein
MLRQLNQKLKGKDDLYDYMNRNMVSESLTRPLTLYSTVATLPTSQEELHLEAHAANSRGQETLLQKVSDHAPECAQLA